MTVVREASEDWSWERDGVVVPPLLADMAPRSIVGVQIVRWNIANVSRTVSSDQEQLIRNY